MDKGGKLFHTHSPLPTQRSQTELPPPALQELSADTGPQFRRALDLDGRACPCSEPRAPGQQFRDFRLPPLSLDLLPALQCPRPPGFSGLAGGGSRVCHDLTLSPCSPPVHFVVTMDGRCCCGLRMMLLVFIHHGKLAVNPSVSPSAWPSQAFVSASAKRKRRTPVLLAQNCVGYVK